MVDVVAEPERGRSHRPVVAYLVLAYALSWAWWVPIAVRGEVVRIGTGWPTHLLGLIGPAIAALVVTGWSEGAGCVLALARRCVQWRAPVAAWLAVGAAVILAVVAAATADRPGDALRFSGAPSWGVATVLVVLVLNGFGEELGWRGFLVPHLRRTRSLRDTSILVWLAWAGWHLPLFWVVANFREFGVVEVIGWVVGLFFGSVFLAWLVGVAEGSVLVVALWHTAYNFATATEAGAGGTAAVATVAVVVATVWIMRTGGGALDLERQPIGDSGEVRW